MENYLVSARKYRPSKFEEVVGQEHITRTLSNAISNNQIAHAYLFCGPRGVGKTTCARIFSELVNNNTNSEYNIFELDGASNNSVDDIRNLIDQVKIPPQIGKYKIYIIDEVHMLSKSAFNAFLKTLEEPPAHSIFILATTEKEKIIPTILSRCQVFDFKRINPEQISDYLTKITQKENIKVETKTLLLIGDKSDGSLRDALSIFDRVYTFFNTTWEHDEVAKILLSLDVNFAIDIVDFIIKKDIGKCLLTIDQIIENGFSSHEIIHVLISHFRNLMLAKDPNTLTLIKVKSDILKHVSKQSQHFSAQQILSILSCLNNCDQNYKKAVNQRFSVELCIMQLCSFAHLDDKKKTLIPLPQNNDANLILSIQKNTPPETNLPINLDNNTVKNIKEEIIKNIEEKKPNAHKGIQEKTTIKSDLISISEELDNTTNIEKSTIKEQNLNEVWTEKELIQCWSEFAEQLIKDQKTNLYNMFERYIPTKKENIINIELVNLTEKYEIESVKLDLLTFIKNKLNNDFINLNIIVKEKNEKKMLYTNDEKLKHLIDNNEDIKLFKNTLDLRVI